MRHATLRATGGTIRVADATPAAVAAVDAAPCAAGTVAAAVDWQAAEGPADGRAGALTAMRGGWRSMAGALRNAVRRSCGYCNRRRTLGLRSVTPTPSGCTVLATSSPATRGLWAALRCGPWRDWRCAQRSLVAGPGQSRGPLTSGGCTALVATSPQVPWARLRRGPWLARCCVLGAGIAKATEGGCRGVRVPLR